MTSVRELQYLTQRLRSLNSAECGYAAELLDVAAQGYDRAGLGLQAEHDLFHQVWRLITNALDHDSFPPEDQDILDAIEAELAGRVLTARMALGQLVTSLKTRSSSEDSTHSKTMDTKPPQHGHVAAAMFECARTVGGCLLALGAIVGLILLAPTIVHWVAAPWYGWGRTITHDYSSVTPAAYIEWGALIGAAWSIYVALKLWECGDVSKAKWFSALAAAIFLLGVLPAQCALYAFLDAWQGTQTHTLIEVMAVCTVQVVMAVPIALVAWVVLGVLVSLAAGHNEG